MALADKASHLVRVHLAKTDALKTFEGDLDLSVQGAGMLADATKEGVKQIVRSWECVGSSFSSTS